MMHFRCRRFSFALAAGLVAADTLPAQGAAPRPTSEAALFLLIPTGARAVGVGHAVAASREPTEAIWWNPAGMAVDDGVIGALHHSQTLVGTGDAATVVVGTRVGTLGLSVNLLSLGSTDVTGSDSVPSGQLLTRDLSYGISWATVVKRRLRVGATWKLLQFRFDCTGECPPLPTLSARGADAGIQVDLPSRLPITAGVAVRNIDARRRRHREPIGSLPTRLQFGLQGHYVIPQRLAREAKVVLAVDAVDELPLRSLSPRVGVELAWEGSVFIRGGYVAERADTDAGGLSLGIGFLVRRLSIDFGRNFSGLSVDAGEAPTFLSLKVGF